MKMLDAQPCKQVTSGYDHLSVPYAKQHVSVCNMLSYLLFITKNFCVTCALILLH